MAGVVRGGLIAVAATALAVGGGVLVLGEDEPAREPAPTYASTPLADFDTATVAVARAAFCDRLPQEAVSEALGGGTGTMASYENGQRAEIASGVEDVAHEYGCRVRADDGSEARAWLFAPPVTRARAADLVRLAADGRGCARQQAAPAYGEPSLALVCRSGDRRTASFRGLFGDAWLSCSVTAPAGLADAALLDRAGRFCVAVAEAARAS